MSVRHSVLAALLLCGGGALAEAATPELPDTPAAQALGAWLEAFNSGDRGRLDEFDRTHFPVLGIERAMRLRDQTGGLDLLSIEKSTATRLTVRVRRRAGPEEDVGVLRLNPTDAALIAGLRFYPLPPGAKFEEVMLDAPARARLIAAVSGLLDRLYVLPQVAKKMSRALRTREKRGAYKDLVDGDAFALRLSDELQDLSHDPHLELRFSPVAQPPETSAGYSEPDAALRRQMMSINCGFDKAEHIAPNIGYLKFDMFADPAICASTAIAAMNFVASSEVLILDLRDNHGGNGDMVALLASYLFDETTHLDDAYDRGKDTTTQSWTWSYVPGQRFVGKPVFVLTSRGTFSAAEDFSYALKNLKRATLIGEATGGGAHMVDPQRIDAHFTLIVPFARSISPITHSNWEGVGVEPDVKVPAVEALPEALKRARELRPNAQAVD
jgi:retinol-binding protein 3